MTFRLPSFKTWALIFLGLVVACLLFGWLMLPRIIQSQAEKFIAEKTGHHLSMNLPEFNPLELSLHLSGVRLTQPNDEPLLAFRELVVDLSAASFYRRAFVFDGIRLDGLEAAVILLPNGQLNWSALIDALKGKDEKSDSPLPRFNIHSFSLSGAKLDFSDKRIAPAFTTRIEPLDMELTEISTVSSDKGQYKVSARTIFGARLDWHGEISLDPLTMNGNVSVADVDIARLASYLKDKLPIMPPAGIAGLSTDYRLGYAGGQLDMSLQHMTAKLTGLRLRGNRGFDPAVEIDTVEAKEGSFDLKKNDFALGTLGVIGSKLELLGGKANARKTLELGSFTLEDAHVNLATHQATLARIVMKDGRVRATRNARGGIDIMEALRAVSPPAPSRSVKKSEVANAVAEAGWHYRVGKLELSGFGAAFRDESVTPAAELALEDIAVGLQGISEDWSMAVPLQASFKVRTGGSFEAQGNVVPFGPAADVRLKLTELNLTPVQPYLSTAVNLNLVEGRLSTEGRASYNAKEAGFRGSFALRNLRLNESDNGNLFLTWKSLGSREFEVTPKKLDMSELALAGLDTKLIINKDKTVSLTKIIKQRATANPTATATPSVPPKAAAPAHSFLVNIDRLRVSSSEMDFADYSLALPFGTRIHDLHGVVTGLSSQPDAPGQLELDGQVDDYGLARAVGQVDLLNPADFMDLKVVFRNIEMTRLTPYSATFAGRKIDSGKLSLDLEYKIHQHQLQDENKIVMDQLVLGERVESPEAKNLPLDLAIAILKDSDGRIDLGLPVSGSLDDPHFSYGGIIWKAIVNVFTRIATAPFRALGALFGGGEKFDNIAFEAGDAQLTPPEREKLVRLAGALGKRPNLSIEVHGVYAEMDRAALQDRQLRRNVLESSGQHVEGDSDPGPISMHQPRIQAALENMFSTGFGKVELAMLKEDFRRTNAKQEVTQPKGAEIYAVLYDRLRHAVVVDDVQLLALAKARGESTVTALEAAGAPAERVAVRAAEKVETEGRDVPLKLVLGAATKSVAPAAAGVPAN